MKVSIGINQIDNGFILHLFDADGPASNDKDLFFENFDKVLEKIKAWTKEASK